MTETFFLKALSNGLSLKDGDLFLSENCNSLLFFDSFAGTVRSAEEVP